MRAVSSYSPTGRTLIRDVTIHNKYGIHARPAAMIVKTASRYEADVFVEKDGNRVSGKSIMGLMTLEAPLGCVLRLTVQGPDAVELMDELAALFEGKFGEE